MLVSRAENFKMVDIEINAWSSFFLNLKTNLILYLYQEKCIKFNQSESGIWSREIWNFARHLRLIEQKREGLSNFENLFFNFSVLYPKKRRLSKKLKVSTVDIRIE